MGTSNSVSSRVSRYRRESVSSDDEWNTLKVLECVGPISFIRGLTPFPSSSMAEMADYSSGDPSDS